MSQSYQYKELSQTDRLKGELQRLRDRLNNEINPTKRTQIERAIANVEEGLKEEKQKLDRVS